MKNNWYKRAAYEDVGGPNDKFIVREDGYVVLIPSEVYSHITKTHNVIGIGSVFQTFG